MISRILVPCGSLFQFPLSHRNPWRHKSVHILVSALFQLITSAPKRTSGIEMDKWMYWQFLLIISKKYYIFTIWSTVKVPNLEHPKISSKLALFRLLIIFSWWNNCFCKEKLKIAHYKQLLWCFWGVPI